MTQAGTYIKEFVHGDFGRTVPNLRTILGVQVDIVALDVEVISYLKKLFVTSSMLNLRVTFVPIIILSHFEQSFWFHAQ